MLNVLGGISVLPGYPGEIRWAKVLEADAP
jgi:hypothetical protein